MWTYAVYVREFTGVILVVTMTVSYDSFQKEDVREV